MKSKGVLIPKNIDPQNDLSKNPLMLDLETYSFKTPKPNVRSVSFDLAQSCFANDPVAYELVSILE
jgi:hypothetical protein